MTTYLFLEEISFFTTGIKENWCDNNYRTISSGKHYIGASAGSMI